MTSKNINRKREGGLLAVVAVAPSIGALWALWFWPGMIGSAIYALCKFVLYGTPAVVAWRGRNELQLRSGFRSGFSARAIGFGLAENCHTGAGERHGSGEMCLSSLCSGGTTVNRGFPGLLWGR